MTDPGLLILASLADGDKHGYSMMLDIQQFAGVELGPARCTERSPALWSRAGFVLSNRTIAAGPIASRLPAAPSSGADDRPRQRGEDRAREAEARMKRWIALASVLYPRSWREEYGEEFSALLDDVRPRWRVFANVLGGAIRMQITNGTNWLKLALAMAIAGAIVAAGASFAVAPRYVSAR